MSTSTTTKRAYLNIRVTDQELAQLRRLAEADNRTISNYTNLILKAHLERRK